jgi:integrase
MQRGQPRLRASSHRPSLQPTPIGAKPRTDSPYKRGQIGEQVSVTARKHMATIRQRGKKWQVQVRRAGSGAVSKSFLRRKDADAWARQMEIRADRTDLPADIAVLKTLKLADLINGYRRVHLAWDRLVGRAGIDLRFHDLRHEAISRFFELGLTIPEVATISGHRDVSMLFRYAHASSTVVFKKLNRTSLLAA